MELGADLHASQAPFEPLLQPQLDPRSTKRKFADLDERDPATVDPLIEELLTEKPAQPLAVRDPDQRSSDEPQVVILQGKDRVIVKTIVVQAPAPASHRIHTRLPRRRRRHHALAISATPQLKIEPVQLAAAPIQKTTWPTTLFWISLAIVGGILIGIVIANRSKLPTKTEVKLRRSARAIRQQS